MQQVSQEWKDAQKQTLVPESFVEVSLNVGEPEAQEDAAASDNGHVFYSNTPQVADETEKNAVRYATLERNIWSLDGTVSILPDAAPYGSNGYIGSALSGQDGTYGTTPTITISFSKVFSALIPGITVTWGAAYDEWAESFRVTAYNGSNIVAQKEVSDNAEVTSVLTLDIRNYDRITVEVLKWCKPSRRARIESILIGIQKVYTKAQIVSYRHSMAVDPLSASLPKAEIKFEISNLNGEYNPDNPQGAEKYLMERQAVKVRYGLKLGGEVEWIKGGTFYTNEWETPQNGITATFTARDLLEFMNDQYEGPVSGSLYDLAEAALTQANLPLSESGANRWALDDTLKNMPLPENLDLGGKSISAVLQLVANAACCVLYQDRDGILHIEPLQSGGTDYRIDRDNSYTNSEISLTKQLKAVNVNDGAAVIQSESTGETQTVKNDLITAERAAAVGQWTEQYLKNRRILSGEWRADPRLDPLDRVTVGNQFAESVVLVTEVEYTFEGAFRGTYEGRANV